MEKRRKKNNYYQVLVLKKIYCIQFKGPKRSKKEAKITRLEEIADHTICSLHKRTSYAKIQRLKIHKW